MPHPTLSKVTWKESSLLVIFEIWEIINWLYLPTAEHIETYEREAWGNGKCSLSPMEQNKARPGAARPPELQALLIRLGVGVGVGVYHTALCIPSPESTVNTACSFGSADAKYLSTLLCLCFFQILIQQLGAGRRHARSQGLGGTRMFYAMIYK